MKSILRIGYFHIFLLVLLILPDDIFSITSLGSFNSPESIIYKWLDYPVSFIHLIFAVIPFFYLNKKIVINAIFIFICLLCRDLLFHTKRDLLVFNNFNLEFYLSILTGIGLFLSINKSKYLDFFHWFLFLHCLTIFVGFFLGRELINTNGVILATNRFNASNLDVGSSGLFMSVFVLHNMTSKKSKPFLVLLSITALILTGSRINFLLLIVFLSIYYRKKIVLYMMSFKKIYVLLCFLFLITSLDFSEYDFLNRITDLFGLLTSNDTSILDDSSFLGRIKSIIVGFDLLKAFPYGIAFSFVDIQLLMQEYDYPTFPHIGFLAWYLAFGPVLFFLIYKYFKLIIQSSKLNLREGVYILWYIIIYNLIAGGLFVNFKIFFFYVFIHMMHCQEVKLKNCFV